MNWKQLLSPARFGQPVTHLSEPQHLRSEFQRDYDRIIFSSPFRRLQNKTQVFPLPGSVFVHNRLTHSLEVASVGRSLGNMVATTLAAKYDNEIVTYLNEIGTIVSTASLAHDLGNPPFGHSGEKAISAYFEKGNGAKYKNKVTQEQWTDLLAFEGNANALRLLTHQFNGRRAGGYALTFATLAALIKYPFPSVLNEKKKKYGYFVSEKEAFEQIAKTTGLIEHTDIKGKYCRHPLVYLVEAADDISYQIMDIEDAHKLNIFSTEKTIELLMLFFNSNGDSWFYKKKHEIFEQVTDNNERIAFLRASVINKLVNKCADTFCNNENAILQGKFTGSLVDYLDSKTAEAANICADISFREIYNHKSVVEIEITGYNVLSTLVDEFTTAAFDPDSNYSKKLLALLPMQYRTKSNDTYLQLRSILDFISGMTDLYAMELYKLIRGIGV